MIRSDHDCSDIFEGFTFQDLRRADPPKAKGVYVIKVAKEGEDVPEIIFQLDTVVERLDWPLLGNKVRNRINRMDRIAGCPYIYIGAAGPSAQSKHTLFGRYRDFSGRHTAMFPIWALLYFGWELEYGYLESKDAGELEKRIKILYKQRHAGGVPALVYR